jgi:bifunctional enzyme CysN/CysC
MTAVHAPLPAPVDAFDAPASLASASQGLLRFLTCGSVDDGKSTLIGRLLVESKAVFEDQVKTLEKDSRRHGTTGEDMDLALLVDGLEAEREQGITIDVAYRFFATPRRSFIVADTPGHEQYTRNMATGASNAELAILLIDARKGVLTQTRRHAIIASLLGIRHVVLAVNKIDLVGFDQAPFDAITADFAAFAKELNFFSVVAIPLSARFGDNVALRSAGTPWYAGPTLLEHLETVDVATSREDMPFRFPVQWVNRPNLDFRGFSGTVASGAVQPGDAVVVSSSGRSSTVRRIATADGDLPRAVAGDAVTLVLADEIDAPRGEVFADPKRRPTVSSRFAAKLVWMAEEPLRLGRSYLLKSGARTVPASVTKLPHRIDVQTLAPTPAATLALNEIGLGEIETTAALAFDPYAENRETGAFILIDRVSNATVAAGMISHGLDAASNVYRHGHDLDGAQRARIKGQKPLVVWLTGLSGSGKSTIANLAEQRLHAVGLHTMLIDGDNLRQDLNRDLGFDAAARAENVRRTGAVAALMADAGLIVLCALVSPFRADRDAVRARFPVGGFMEVHVDTPLDICRERDPKGLYARAETGKVVNLTGVGGNASSAYEPPSEPELVLHAGAETAADLAEMLVAAIRERMVDGPETAIDSAGL